jgi:hypothetical protein
MKTISIILACLAQIVLTVVCGPAAAIVARSIANDDEM